MVDKNIIKERWYHGLLPREDIKLMLTHPGDFLVRSTEPVAGQPRQYVLSAVGEKDHMPTHFVMHEKHGKVFIDHNGYESIVKLVDHYTVLKDPIYTKDKQSKIILKTAIGRQKWERQHDEVVLAKKLGEGAFGEVWKGQLMQPDSKSVDVAVKTAKLESLNKEQIKEIMHEARLMRNLDHPNVVKFYGVAAGQEPLYVIMELADGGALDSALQKNKFTMVRKMELIWQASCGVSYLHESSILHRDIAARNCLYGGGQVKIADFGLSREGTEYIMDLSKKVPIRWLPPETIKTGLYNQKVDVYAFGIMAWEITEDGKEPYPGLKVSEVVPKVMRGYRMPFDLSVDKLFAEFIKDKCWGEDPQTRMWMKDIEDFLKNNFVPKSALKSMFKNKKKSTSFSKESVQTFGSKRTKPKKRNSPSKSPMEKTSGEKSQDSNP